MEYVFEVPFEIGDAKPLTARYSTLHEMHTQIKKMRSDWNELPFPGKTFFGGSRSPEFAKHRGQ